MNDLLKSARQMHAVGTNVVPLGSDSKPVLNWKHWRERRQLPAEIRQEDYADAEGLAIVLGVGSVRAITYAGSRDEKEVIAGLTDMLELPMDYRWFMRNDQRLYVVVLAHEDDRSLETWQQIETSSGLDVRWDGQLLAVPPTQHPKFGAMEFGYGRPVEPPKAMSTAAEDDLLDRAQAGALLAASLRRNVPRVTLAALGYGDLPSFPLDQDFTDESTGGSVSRRNGPSRKGKSRDITDSGADSTIRDQNREQGKQRKRREQQTIMSHPDFPVGGKEVEIADVVEAPVEERKTGRFSEKEKGPFPDAVDRAPKPNRDRGRPKWHTSEEGPSPAHTEDEVLVEDERITRSYALDLAFRLHDRKPEVPFVVVPEAFREQLLTVAPHLANHEGMMAFFQLVAFGAKAGHRGGVVANQSTVYDTFDVTNTENISAAELIAMYQIGRAHV